MWVWARGTAEFSASLSIHGEWLYCQNPSVKALSASYPACTALPDRNYNPKQGLVACRYRVYRFQIGAVSVRVRCHWRLVLSPATIRGFGMCCERSDATLVAPL